MLGELVKYVGVFSLCLGLFEGVSCLLDAIRSGEHSAAIVGRGFCSLGLLWLFSMWGTQMRPLYRLGAGIFA